MAKIKRECGVVGCMQPHDAKGYCHAHYKRWKLHGDPLISKQAPHGSGWMQQGYKYFTINGKNTREHIIVAERALGKPLPAGSVVHHVDEDRNNNAPENLVICPSHKYHHHLHQRMRARAACGNPNWRKCPFCHRYDDPINMRQEKSGRCVHCACSAAVQKRRRDARNISASC